MAAFLAVRTPTPESRAWKAYGPLIVHVHTTLGGQVLVRINLKINVAPVLQKYVQTVQLYIYTLSPRQESGWAML